MAIEWKSTPQSLLRLPLIQVGINTTYNKHRGAAAPDTIMRQVRSDP
jgi:hypothetical protein